MAKEPPIIAVVDDDRIFQFTASKIIKATQITDRIHSFLSAEEALNFLRANASDTQVLPDYIFLDINMPYLDGWMFLDDFDKLKSKLSKGIKIYMVSSSIDPRDIERAKRNRHVSDYVIKPVTMEKFVELLRTAA